MAQLIVLVLVCLALHSSQQLPAKEKGVAKMELNRLNTGSNEDLDDENEDMGSSTGAPVVDPCVPNPCQNGGLCYPEDWIARKYKCVCDEVLHNGPLCEHDINQDLYSEEQDSNLDDLLKNYQHTDSSSESESSGGFHWHHTFIIVIPVGGGICGGGAYWSRKRRVVRQGVVYVKQVDEEGQAV